MTRGLRTAKAEEDTTADASGFEAFFALHADRLFGSLCLILRNRAEAEEVAQEAFLIAWERWPRVATLDDPVGYLFRTGMNLARKRIRRGSIASRLLVGRAAAPDAIDVSDDRTTVDAALSALTPRQRLAIVLTELLDLPARDAASVMGVKASTVRALATQGRAVMRARIGETT
jgi:RNA polymerase sigma-70 factor (ECF subfamily)